MNDVHFTPGTGMLAEYLDDPGVDLAVTFAANCQDVPPVVSATVLTFVYPVAVKQTVLWFATEVTLLVE